MKKVFISQPMTGLTKEQIEANTKKYLKYAEDILDVEVDLVFEYVESVQPPLYWLGRAISQMAYSDVIFFAPGFRDSKGCCIEFIVAKLYKRDIRYINL